jgi:hypothetical protein
MEIKDVIGMARDIAPAVGLLVAGWLAIFVFRQFAPVLTLRIVPTWTSDDSRWVVLRLEVENKSRIRVRKRSIYLQVLEPEVREGGSLSEWVPFEEKHVDPDEWPAPWQEPFEVFKTTSGIDPGEILVAERLHYCPPNGVLHVGLQVKAQLGVFGKIATWVRGNNQSWTTTCIIMKRSLVARQSGNARARHA